jgi:hypothetical protein
MESVRLDRSKLTFPPECARCGRSQASRLTRLVLPYQAWWRSNPAVLVPVCLKCSVTLAVESWSLLILELGFSLGAAFFLPRWGINLFADVERALFQSVSSWVVSSWTAEIAVLGVVLLLFFPLESFRRRFLRAQLRLKITDYRNDWVEISSSDDHYLRELTKDSKPYQEA